MTFTDEDLKYMCEELLPSLQREDMKWYTATKHFYALLTRLEAAEKLAFEGEGCTNCPNQGWYIQPSDGEPIQEQCQFCVENPISRFNLEDAWRKAAGKDL